jgi:hypothetical protein
MCVAAMKRLGWRFWWAGPKDRFTYPGLYVWLFRRNIRLIPCWW